MLLLKYKLDQTIEDWDLVFWPDPVVDIFSISLIIFTNDSFTFVPAWLLLSSSDCYHEILAICFIFENIYVQW